MGYVLASDNQDWWAKLNSMYSKFAGVAITDESVEIGDNTMALEINNFLTLLGGLKNYNYSSDIDWSDYDSESLKERGDLLKLITVTNITTTLSRLDSQCVHNDYCPNYSDDGHNGRYSDDSDDGHQSVCANYTDNSEKSQSSHSTEPSGYGDSNTRSQGDTETFSNVTHNKDTT